MFQLSPSKSHYEEILELILIISRFPLQDMPELEKKLKNQGEENIIRELARRIDQLNLKALEQKIRIYLIDSAVKSGNLQVVTQLTEKFIKEGFTNDIAIPSAHNMEAPFRPTFWLASTVTRYRPVVDYQNIENYLCQRLNIGPEVIINGRATTRSQYVKDIDQWKHEQNIKIMTQFGRKKSRYRRHELLDAIEKFNPDHLHRTKPK